MTHESWLLRNSPAGWQTLLKRLDWKTERINTSHQYWRAPCSVGLVSDGQDSSRGFGTLSSSSSSRGLQPRFVHSVHTGRLYVYSVCVEYWFWTRLFCSVQSKNAKEMTACRIWLFQLFFLTWGPWNTAQKTTPTTQSVIECLMMIMSDWWWWCICCSSRLLLS